MQKTGVSSRRWLALLAVTSAFTYTFIGRYIWSPLMADVSAEFSLSSAQGGIYMSAFFLGYVITQIPGGLLADRIDPKIVLISSTLIGGLAAALMSQVSGFQMGIAFRLLAGLAGGFVFSCCSKVVSSAFQSHERSVALGILLASPPLGITIASLMGPLLKGALGWRATFLVVGGLSLLVVLALLLFIGKVEVPKEEPAGGKPSFLEGFSAFTKNRNQWFLALAAFMFMLTTTGFPTWVSGFTRALGYTQAQTTLIAMSYSIAGIAGSIFSGFIAKKLKLPHRAFLMLALLCMAGLSLLLSLGWRFGGFAAIGILYGFISYLPAAHFTALVIDFSKPQHSATSVASHNLFQQSASVIQPILLGFGIDLTGGYAVIWYVFALAMLIAAASARLTRKASPLA